MDALAQERTAWQCRSGFSPSLGQLPQHRLRLWQPPRLPTRPFQPRPSRSRAPPPPPPPPPAPAGPEHPIVLQPPTKTLAGGGVVFAATNSKPDTFAPPKPPAEPHKFGYGPGPKKPAVFAPPSRQPTGWLAAAAAQEVPKAPVLLKSDSAAAAEEESPKPKQIIHLDPPSKAADAGEPKKLIHLDPPADPTSSAAETPAATPTVLLKAVENATQNATQEPQTTDHDIHDEIFKAHQDMCKDGRMDSEHCAKFRETLDTMHKEIETMHDEHTAVMAETSAAEPAAEPSAAAVEVKVESVEEHEPVIKKHEYPYKTGPCASGATVVALLFSGLLFA